MKGIFPRKAYRRNSWRAFFVVFTLIAAAGVPLYLGNHSSAQMSTTMGTVYVADLTGAPIGNITPAGAGHYFADSSGNRAFQVQVGNVALPGGTNLGVFVDGTAVGQIRLSMFHNGMLQLSTLSGQTVPTVNNGSTLVVKNAGTAILSGTFSIPPTPFPTPTSGFFAPLNGPTIDGIMPRGFAAYAEFGTTSRRLGVFANHVHLPQGTHLGVFVDSAQVGEIVLDMDGDGGLRLDTANGDTVPTVVLGSTAAVKNGATVVLSGTFQAPSPTPFPSVTPHPTPRPNRFFGGRLGGRQVVPPVATQAHGLVFVALNDTETQIHVWLGFIRLSSDQTSAKIYGPAIPGETAPALFDLGAIGGTAGRFLDKTFDVTAEQVAQLRSGLWYVQVGSANNPDGEIRGQIHGRTRPSAFSGTQTDDIAVFRPSDGTWYVKNGDSYTTQQLGSPGDKAVSADFDGDGVTDSAVFRDGNWLISRSSDGGVTTKQFGLPGDIPVRGDFDGDGVADFAVFRPSTGVWYVEKSGGSGYIILQFGLNGDIPVAADLDGDGKTDIALFRPSTGVWYWLGSKDGAFGAVQFGMSGDRPIVGDFDGDGMDDVSVWRPSTGVWYISKSTGGYDIRQFGVSTDIPVAGNYDGDGATDIAVFRPSTGVWYIWRSSDNTFDYKFFGTDGDIPAAAN